MKDPSEISLQRIAYWVNWLSKSFATGKWLSHFSGRGFDYRETAPFQDYPGPKIDWPATATTGELQVRVFAEEHGIDIFLLGDLSHSMAFGTEWSKIERLALLAALLAFSANRAKDHFRFIGFTDEVETGFPRLDGPAYPFVLAEMILGFESSGKGSSGLVSAATQILSRQRSLVILASDFLGDLAQVEEVLQLLSSRHDLLPIVLWDKRELDWPTSILPVPISDLETGQVRYVWPLGKTRRAIQENSVQQRRKIEKICGDFGIDPYFFTEVEQSDVEGLVDAFLSRRSGFS